MKPVSRRPQEPVNRVPRPRHLSQDSPVEKKKPKRQVNITLNKKFLGHDIIAQLRDVVISEGMLAGNAVKELIEEYDKMRYILEGIVTAHERGEHHRVQKAIDTLRILL